jgi:hypothetical protein
MATGERRRGRRDINTPIPEARQTFYQGAVAATMVVLLLLPLGKVVEA